MPVETRPATTTFMGDTGLWFVPVGDVLPARRWSVSAYRVNFDYTEGFTDVSNWPITFGVGLKNRAEIFAAVQAVRRIDRDARPIFFNTQGGGVTNEYPLMRDAWSGSEFGDIWLGAKINLASQFDQKPVAFGLRGMLKLPTADDEDPGVGTGKMDFAFDAIVSKEINERVELSGFGGMIFRGSPDDVSISNGFRYGFGLGLPSRKGLRLTAELHGESYFDDSVEMNRTLTGIDGSVAPGFLAALVLVLGLVLLEVHLDDLLDEDRLKIVDTGCCVDRFGGDNGAPLPLCGLFRATALLEHRGDLGRDRSLARGGWRVDSDGHVRRHAVEPRDLDHGQGPHRGDRGRQPADADPARGRAQDDGRALRRRCRARGGPEVYFGRVGNPRGGGGLTGVSRTIELTNKRGPHARAPAKFVTMASQLDAEVDGVERLRHHGGRLHQRRQHGRRGLPGGGRSV